MRPHFRWKTRGGAIDTDHSPPSDKVSSFVEAESWFGFRSRGKRDAERMRFEWSPVELCAHCLKSETHCTPVERVGAKEVQRDQARTGKGQ